MADLTYGGTNIRRADKTIFFNVILGFDDFPTFRGENVIVPGKDGRTEMTRRKDLWPVLLRG